MPAVTLFWPEAKLEERVAVPKLHRMVELARKHVVEGGAMAAGVYYRMILKDTTPPESGVERLAHGEACVWYARWARSKGRLGEAADWYHQALNADPLAVEIYSEFILKCLLPMGMIKEAKLYAERAAKIAPDTQEVLHLLGGVAHRADDVEGSIAAYDRQLELFPEEYNGYLDRATIALDTADYDTVRKLCNKVLDTDSHADALHCLAMADYREGKHESAIELYDKAIEAGCYDPAMARWNKSLALHSIGRYKQGWAEHEQRELQTTDRGMSAIMKRFVLPRWQGEPAPAKLHLHQEMGLGDTICMARYAPILTDQGYDVRMEVNDNLVSLFKRSFPEVMVIPKAIDYPAAFGVKPFDYHCPMLSLPAVMKTDIDTVPWEGPYLKADPELIKQYQSKLPGGMKIGLCWSSGIRNEGGIWLAEYGRRKSMSFRDLDPIIKRGCSHEELFELPNFISLQVGPERSEHKDYIYDVLPDKPTWDDTAALIECLDLVITVDTSVAHLAGAMGKPVWLMMHTEGSWHWMAERPGASWNETSPWYPSVRIFRQKKPHEWGTVIKTIAKELK